MFGTLMVVGGMKATGNGVMVTLQAQNPDENCVLSVLMPQESAEVFKTAEGEEPKAFDLSIGAQ